MRYLVIATILAAGAAHGQAMDRGAISDMLYQGVEPEVELLAQDFLPADQAALLKTVGVSQPYYGAIAVSPDEGIMVEATVAAANYHTTEAASAAALKGCNAARKGARACEVVALIRPKGWQQHPVQMSSAATDDFEENYRGRGAKAFAISTVTGDWGRAETADAALAECGTGCRILMQQK